MKRVPKSFVWWVVILAIACVGFVACDKPASIKPPSSTSQIDPLRGHLLQAQPRLSTVKVWLGSEEMIAEICREPVEIATGMMFRTNMAENEAMLFIFPNAQPRNFYMRNCTVPLSAAYIEPGGNIAEIIDLQPGDEVGVQSKTGNIQFVLEVPQGWFTRHNIRTGAVIRTERGSLMETFFRR